MAAADRGVEGKAVLNGCAKQMATYKFVYLTAFLSDAVGLLCILSKSMQKETASFSSLKPLIDSTIDALKPLLFLPTEPCEDM